MRGRISVPFRIKVQAFDLGCTVSKRIALKDEITHIRNKNWTCTFLAVSKSVAEKWEATPTNLNILVRSDASVAFFVFLALYFVIFQNLVGAISEC